MRTYSTREAARMLGVDRITLQRYIAKKVIVAPALRKLGGGRFREWSSRDIEKVRKQLPKVRNGRRRRKKK